MDQLNFEPICLPCNEDINKFNNEKNFIEKTSKSLETIKNLSELEQKKFCSNLDAEEAKYLYNLINFGKNFIGNKTKRVKQEMIFNSKKPLWIDEVKKTCKEIMPKIDINEIENSKNILSQEEIDDHLFDPEEYPYFQTIKKLLYAFGDTYKNNPRTIMFMHNFAKKWILLIIRIISECEFKKIMDHLYSYEYSKFFNYKKLKFKNVIKPEYDDSIHGNDNKKKEKNRDDSDSDLDDENLDYSIKVEKNPISNIDLGLNLEEIIPNNNDVDFKLNLDTPALNMIINENCLDLHLDEKDSKNGEQYNQIIENIFEDKDEFYYENLAFQDQRTLKMNEAEYLEYINCRIQSFLTRGKKLFLNYLQNIITSSNMFMTKNPKCNVTINKPKIFNGNSSSLINSNLNNSNNSNYSINNINDEDLIELQKNENAYNQIHNINFNSDSAFNVPYELKDQGNLELLCFILKEIMHKIVKQAIKEKSPEKKLSILKFALNVEDLEKYANLELEKLELFLSDYSVSIYLMKEFKKKKFCKSNNKNVKIKKNKGAFYVIIKKYVFLDNDDVDFFRKNKKVMEEKVSNKFKVIYNEYVKQTNNKRSLSTKSKKGKKDEFEDLLIVIEEEKNLLKEIDKKYLINYLNLDHYYEYYLLKDILKEVNDKKVFICFNKIKKITKKYFNKKFDWWIKTEPINRQFYKNEFNNIMGIKDKINDII